MIASPLRPRHRQESGIAAAGQLAHQGTPYGASLSFATTTHLWPLPDPPSRKSRSATSRTGTARSIPGRALASSVLDSPCQGSRTGLTPPISTSVPSTPVALRAPAPRRRSRIPRAASPQRARQIRPPAPLPCSETRIHHQLSPVVDRQTGSGQPQSSGHEALSIKPRSGSITVRSKKRRR